MKKLCALGALSLVLGLSSVALADEKAPAPKKEEAKKEAVKAEAKPEVKVSKEKDGKGYGYDFDDDRLLGGGNAPGGGSVVVRPVHRGALLLRPRISFVDAMLKSVENL